LKPNIDLLCPQLNQCAIGGAEATLHIDIDKALSMQT
jgi:hypothetical protein